MLAIMGCFAYSFGSSLAWLFWCCTLADLTLLQMEPAKKSLEQMNLACSCRLPFQLLPPECIARLQSFLNPRICPRCQGVCTMDCHDCGEAHSACLYDDFFLLSDYDENFSLIEHQGDIGYFFCHECQDGGCPLQILAMMLRGRERADVLWAP